MAAGNVTDSFNRADGALGVTDGGTLSPLTWTNQTGSTWNVSSNKAQAATPGGPATVDIGQPNHDVQVTLSTIAAGSTTGLVTRYKDDNNYWILAVFAGAGPLLLKKKVAGVTTLVHTFSNVANGDIIKVRSFGAGFDVYINGSFNSFAVDADLNAEHLVGMWSSDSTSRLDAFSSTRLNAPNPVTFTPDHGPVAGGTAVTIDGQYFTGTTGVSFGGDDATSVVVVSDIQITCVTPAHIPAGLLDPQVQGPNGGGQNGGFTYQAPLTVSGNEPASGLTEGGQVVVITGTGFTGMTTVKFGADDALSVSVDDDSQITATSPPGVPGTVEITVAP